MTAKKFLLTRTTILSTIYESFCRPINVPEKIRSFLKRKVLCDDSSNKFDQFIHLTTQFLFLVIDPTKLFELSTKIDLLVVEIRKILDRLAKIEEDKKTGFVNYYFLKINNNL